METTSQEKLLTLREAGKIIGRSDRHLAWAIRNGRLKGRIVNEARPGRPAYFIRREDLDEFARETVLRDVDQLPAELEDVIVPLTVAASLVRRDIEVIADAARRGRLRAGYVTTSGSRHWHVRLADLAEWFARPGRGPRVAMGRAYDPEVLSQLKALVAGGEGKGSRDAA